MNEDDIVQVIIVPHPDEYDDCADVALVAMDFCTNWYTEYVTYKDKANWYWKYFDEWLNGRFTKSVRRARGKDQAKIANELNEADIDYDWYQNDNGLSVICLPPLPYSLLPRSVRKTQVAGIQYKTFEDDPEIIDGDHYKYLFCVNPHLEMTHGKMIAQLCHAAMAVLIEDLVAEEDLWYGVYSTEEYWEYGEPILVINDAGFTEIEPGSETVRVFEKR